MHMNPRRALSAAICCGGLVLVIGACAPSSTATPTPPPAAAGKPAPPAGSSALVQQGQQLAAQKGCGGCHTIPGVAGATGTIGPNLAGVASRTTIAGGAVPNNG